MASDTAAQLNVLAQLPPETTQPTTSHPLLSHHHNAPAPHLWPIWDPDAMEIDAAWVLPVNTDLRLLLDASRVLCRVRQLCFCCLSPIVPGSHTGSLTCLNAPVSPEQRKAFVNRCRQLPSATVAMVNTPPATVPAATLTYHASPNTAPTPAPKAPDHMDFQRFQEEELGFDEVYAEYEEVEEALVSVPIATVHIKLDHSTAGCLLVPILFKDQDVSLFPATVLVDTGAMANFVNKEFEAVGGVVTEDWAGRI
ncbi:hypothetical protein PCASD_09627 [Puccinia coronata f. sp. avenae]|uniref:Uncharacterized protein n=1 Tax=Puccinia coronata f. sp. avenae TaxID=200324 RepID=A0A2N5UQ10_9BASI|nr:hypothetical protein PCASD_09627 [Puccinia coronata f. sp. avenae]